MLILLMVTATATFAIHATAAEVRASGHSRVAMQTGYMAESALTSAMDWVDRTGPRVLVDVMNQRSTMTPLDMSPFEPTLDASKVAHRLYVADLDTASAAPVEEGEAVPNPAVVPSDVFGSRSVYEPVYVVDIYDHHVYTGVMPGYGAGGGVTMRYVRATYTARGRARLRDSVGASSATTDYHQTAGDARAMGISGPFAM